MKPIYFSRHALDRMLSSHITEDIVIKTIQEGEIKREGKSKFRAVKRSKKGLIIAICNEYADHIKIITLMKR